MSGIYIHIPYCRQACSYCDFHFSTSRDTMPALIRAICAEIKLRAAYPGTSDIASIYLGGGTPSLLSGGHLDDLFDTLAACFNWKKDAEITIEANPDDINPQLLKLWSSRGINRISLGLQSFDERELRWMNRAHSAAEGLAAVKMAQDAGFNNMSVDLIYGSKFQDLAGWVHTLRTVTQLGVPHISSYNLTLEKKTLLGSRHAKGSEPPVNEEFSGRQFVTMSDYLTAEGFVHYEISNFAKPGYEAVHNSNYWKQKTYLGLGPSAHSFNGVSRQWNVKNNNLYIKALQSGEKYFEREELSTRDRYNEYVLTRLRTIWGCDAGEIKELFGEVFSRHFLDLAGQKKHFFSVKNEVYVLNKAGRLLADGIASDLFFL